MKIYEEERDNMKRKCKGLINNNRPYFSELQCSYVDTSKYYDVFDVFNTYENEEALYCLFVLCSDLLKAMTQYNEEFKQTMYYFII